MPQSQQINRDIIEAIASESPKNRLRSRMRPAGGIAPLIHVAFRIVLPVLVFVLSSLGIGVWLPLLVVFLSKWRIFAVRPRFWPANLRANGVDIMVGVSIVTFMDYSGSLGIRLVWAVVYAAWLLFIKPKSNIMAISVQAGIGQLAGLMALFVAWSDGPLLGLVLASGLICYLAARHFFDSYSEPYAKMLAYLWAYFAAALMWVLGHLLVVYPRNNGKVAQPVIFLSVIGYTLAAVYYLEHFEKLSLTIKRELLYLCGGAVIILLVSLFYEGTHLIV
jgi:hypothetical protein